MGEIVDPDSDVKMPTGTGNYKVKMRLNLTHPPVFTSQWKKDQN